MRNNIFVLGRVRAVEHAEGIVKTLLLKQVFVRHVAFPAGAHFRFDRESIGSGEHSFHTFVAQFLKINISRTPVGGIFFVTHDRQLILIDQCVSDLVKKNEPHRIEHFLISDIVTAATCLKDLEEMFHQFVANRYRTIAGIVKGVYLITILGAKRNVLGEDKCTIKSVGCLFETLFLAELQVDLRVF